MARRLLGRSPRRAQACGRGGALTATDVEQSVEVDAPRERVWELLTDPVELPRWWPDAAELEPRVGGRVVLAFGPGEVTGEVTSWEPPTRLGFTWEASNHPEITRTIAAPPDRVFRALTDAGELARWWTSSGESDARTGGAFSYCFEFEDPSRDHTYTGDYHDVTADERVSYPWQTSLGETTVDVRLRPSGDGMELTLAHTGWGTGAEAEEAVAMHEHGWSFFLDNLKSYLEGGGDLRVGAAMGQ